MTNLADKKAASTAETSRPSPRAVIGLTGVPSSGKGEVTAALLRCAEERGRRAAHLSFSDCIKEEARRRGVEDKDFDRELLSQLGVEMREAEGPGVLAARIAQKIQDWPAPRPELFVVEALRHAGEIDTLKSAFGDRFILVAVDSEPREIARRLIARRRPDESPEALRSEEDAVRLLQDELKGTLSPLGPNVGDCMVRADVQMSNNGTLDALRQTVARFFGGLVSQRRL